LLLTALGRFDATLQDQVLEFVPIHLLRDFLIYFILDFCVRFILDDLRLIVEEKSAFFLKWHRWGYVAGRVFIVPLLPVFSTPAQGLLRLQSGRLLQGSLVRFLCGQVALVWLSELD
jgi:hypothetical protein